MSLPAQKSHHATVHRMPTRKYDFTSLRREARCDSSLPAFARLFFEDVCELSESKGYCWAEDEYFAEKFGVTERAVRKWKTALIDAGYLRRTTRAGKQVLVPVSNGENKVESDNRNNGSESGTSVPSEEQRFQEARNDGSNTKSYIPPEGGEIARAHEGAAGGSGDEPRKQPSPDGDRPSHAPTLQAVKQRAAMAGIPAEMAEEFFWYYEAQEWMTSGGHPRPVGRWEAKLMQWKLQQPAFEPADKGRGSTGTNSLPTVTAEEIAARAARKAEARKRREGQD